MSAAAYAALYAVNGSSLKIETFSEVKSVIYSVYF